MSGDSWGPAGFTVTCTHDESPLTFKGARWSWEGDFEIVRTCISTSCRWEWGQR